MEVANASVYDHSNAVIEAAIMCASVNKKNKVLVSETLNPSSRKVLDTYAKGQGIEVVLINEKDGVTDIEDLKNKIDDDVACVMVQSPNFFGIIEDLEECANITHTAKKASFVAAVDPISLGILKNRAIWALMLLSVKDKRSELPQNSEDRSSDLCVQQKSS